MKILFLITLLSSGDPQHVVINSGTGADCIAWLIEMERRDPIIQGFRSCRIDHAPESW